jgi:hypothetical protein
MVLDEDVMADWKMDFPQLSLDPAVAKEPEWYCAASLTNNQSAHQAAPPTPSFIFQNDMVVMPLGDLAGPPRAPAPHPAEDAAALLLQNVSTDDVPLKNYNDDVQQIYAGFGEDQPLLVESLESDLSVGGIAPPQDIIADFQMNFPELFGGGDQVMEVPNMYGATSFAGHQPTSQVAPPCDFFQNMEQVGDMAMPPCAPAAQPEDDASGLLQTVTADDVPRHEPCAPAAQPEELPEPDMTAADEGIYGLPCPAFSPEMIRACLMVPWESLSSVPMTFGLY